jgi:hypothetical protein
MDWMKVKAGSFCFTWEKEGLSEASDEVHFSGDDRSGVLPCSTVLGQQTASTIHPEETNSQETNIPTEARGVSGPCQKLREHYRRNGRRMGQSYFQKEERWIQKEAGDWFNLLRWWASF